MLTHKIHLARPTAARRAAVVPSRGPRFLVRADKSEALKELENFSKSAASRMQETVDEAESAPALTVPVVFAAQVRHLPSPLCAICQVSANASVFHGPMLAYMLGCHILYGADNDDA